MATTGKTVFPITPISTPWGTQGAMPTLSLPVVGSATIVKGDLIQESGTAGLVTENNASAANTAIGFAAGPKTAPATPDNNTDVVLIYPCMPSVVFEGNVVTDANNDETGVLADNLLVRMAIVEADTDAVAALRQSAGTAIAYGLYYTRQKDGSLGPASGVSKTNPRTAFVVYDSVWSPIA